MLFLAIFKGGLAMKVGVRKALVLIVLALLVALPLVTGFSEKTHAFNYTINGDHENNP